MDSPPPETQILDPRSTDLERTSIKLEPARSKKNPIKGRSNSTFLSESWIKSNQVFKGRSKVAHAPLFFLTSNQIKLHFENLFFFLQRDQRTINLFWIVIKNAIQTPWSRIQYLGLCRPPPPKTPYNYAPPPKKKKSCNIKTTKPLIKNPSRYVFLQFW